jgi:hypothetical protein
VLELLKPQQIALVGLDHPILSELQARPVGGSAMLTK